MLMVPFTIALFQETITSASSITQGLTSELLDGQRKLLALVASGNPVPHNTTSVLQPANGPVPSLPKVLLFFFATVGTPCLLSDRLCSHLW